MKPVTRRELLKVTGILAAMVAAPALTACSSVQPSPFIAGKEMAAPLGCEQLRARNHLGDC